MHTYVSARIAWTDGSFRPSLGHCGLLPMVRSTLSVRRIASAEELPMLHHKQKRCVMGVMYHVSKARTAADVPIAKGKGFTEVKVGGNWIPIDQHAPKAHGGPRGDKRPRDSSIPARHRPRQKLILAARSQVLGDSSGALSWACRLVPLLRVQCDCIPS